MAKASDNPRKVAVGTSIGGGTLVFRGTYKDWPYEVWRMHDTGAYEGWVEDDKMAATTSGKAKTIEMVKRKIRVYIREGEKPRHKYTLWESVAGRKKPQLTYAELKRIREEEGVMNPGKKKLKKGTSVAKRRAAVALAEKGVPAKKRGESWMAYHDRLSALASELVDAGASGARVNRVLAVAGEIARVHKSIRTRARKGKSKGPGTYPWEDCVRQAMRQYAGTADVEQRARRVCGAIRARSKRRYPAYWRAREPGRRIPSPKPGGRWNPDYFGQAQDRELIEEYKTLLTHARKGARTDMEKVWLKDQLEWSKGELRRLSKAKPPGESSGRRGASGDRGSLRQGVDERRKRVQKLKRQIARI